MGNDNIFIALLTFTAICIASYYDAKKRIIPLWIFPGIFIITLILKIAMGAELRWDFMGMAIVLLAALIATLDGMGGGDVIMFSVISFVIGSRNIIPFFLLIAAILLLYVITYKFVLKKKGKMQVPLAPF